MCAPQLPRSLSGACDGTAAVAMLKPFQQWSWSIVDELLAKSGEATAALLTDSA